MSTNHVPHQGFEEHYAVLRKPIGASGYDGGNPVESAVRAGDVDVLEAILANGKLRDMVDSSYAPLAVIYAMSHWLVDNSGREDLAQRWMAEAGHTPKLAAEYFELLSGGVGRIELMRRESKKTGNLSDLDIDKFDAQFGSDVRQLLTQQRSLGLASLIDVFLPMEKGVPAPYRAMGNMGGMSVIQDSMNMLLASILRMHHPVGPPQLRCDDDYEKKPTAHEPMIHHCWTEDTLGRFLPAIELSYGRGNPEIEQQMTDGIAEHLASGKLVLVGSPMDRSWQLMKDWGGPAIAEQIWQSRVVKTPFVMAMCNSWSSVRERRAQELLDMGANINAISDCTTDAKDEKHMRMLDAAVLGGKKNAVLWLLERGADPTLQIRSSNEKDDGMSTVQLAEMVAGLSSTKSSDTEGIAAILRATVAKRVADAAIAELGMDIRSPGSQLR